MPQPPPARQFTHSGPGGFLKYSISSTAQHIVHGPQDFPGAAVIRPSRELPARRIVAGRASLLSSFPRQRESQSSPLRPTRTPSADDWNLSRRPELIRQLSKEARMDKEHIKGAADKAKGAVNDAAGKLMNDKSLQ